MRSMVLMLAGVLMILSSAAHGLLGWPLMRTELGKVGAGEALVGGLATGWYFGSVAMLAFGIVVFIFGLRLRRQDLSGVVPVGVIAASYLVFGLAAFARSFNPHFLVFIFTGILAGIPVLGLKQR